MPVSGATTMMMMMTMCRIRAIQYRAKKAEANTSSGNFFIIFDLQCEIYCAYGRSTSIRDEQEKKKRHSDDSFVFLFLSPSIHIQISCDDWMELLLREKRDATRILILCRFFYFFSGPSSVFSFFLNFIFSFLAPSFFFHSLPCDAISFCMGKCDHRDKDTFNINRR